MRRIALLTVGLFFVGLSFAEDSGGNNALFGDIPVALFCLYF
jgi:hypothetical protein